MRYLAIDPGGKRTGLAAGDDETRIITPLNTVHAGDDASRLAGILRALDRQGADALIIGLPLNMDGSEGPPARAARQLAATLRDRAGLSVTLVDERLSSAEADEAMARTGMTRGRKKQTRDALAACAILRRYLHEIAPSDSHH